jgi:hypothetical protein
VFVGGYPTHTVDALVAPRPEGAIVLMNQGVLTAAFTLGAILAAAVPYESDGREVPPELPERSADIMIADLVTALVRGIVPRPFELRSERRAAFASFLGEYLIDFVLAHELAHVLLGHLDRDPETVVPSGAHEVRISLPSWQHELAADERAFELLSAVVPDQVSRESRYMPPTLLFELLECEASVRRPRTAPPFSLDHVAALRTHPRSAERRSALVVSTHPDGPLATMPRVDMLIERMAAARGQPPHRPSREALDRLLELAAGFESEPLERLLGMGAGTVQCLGARPRPHRGVSRRGSRSCPPGRGHDGVRGGRDTSHDP